MHFIQNCLLAHVGFHRSHLLSSCLSFHFTWLPDAHGERPTAGSLILAGLSAENGRIWYAQVCGTLLFPEVVGEGGCSGYGGRWCVDYLRCCDWPIRRLTWKRLVAFTSVEPYGVS